MLYNTNNLIKNSSFELLNIPINWASWGGGVFDNSVTPEQQIVSSWNIYNSPDYFTPSYPYSNHARWLPINDFGNSYAKNGNAYAGIGVYLNNPTLDVQEYIYQQLTSPLKQDSVYCLSFFLTYSDRAKIAIKDIGASFSITTPILNPNGYINTIPQIINTLGFLTDTINWVEVKGCFTAQGGENYITIGNFNSHVNTDTLRTLTLNPFPTGGIEISYYYIDSVSLWQNNFPTFIKEEQKNEFVSVYPNPANDVINFKFSDANTKRKIELYNTIGELVLSEDAPTQNSSLNIHHLSNGIYFYCILVNGIKVNTNKIVIIK